MKIPCMSISELTLYVYLRTYRTDKKTAWHMIPLNSEYIWQRVERITWVWSKNWRLGVVRYYEYGVLFGEYGGTRKCFGDWSAARSCNDSSRLNSSLPNRSSPKLPLPIFLPTRQFGPTMRTLDDPPELPDRLVVPPDLPTCRLPSCMLGSWQVWLSECTQSVWEGSMGVFSLALLQVTRHQKV